MAMADTRQRIMPMPDDRLPPRGQQLAYPEAVLLVNPINPDLKGEVINGQKATTLCLQIFMKMFSTIPCATLSFHQFQEAYTKFSSIFRHMQVDDKYQYSIENKDNKVHGWISGNPPTGYSVMNSFLAVP